MTTFSTLLPIMIGVALVSAAVFYLIGHGRGYDRCDRMWQREWDEREKARLDRASWTPTEQLAEVAPVHRRLTDTIAHPTAVTVQASTIAVPVNGVPVVLPVRTEVVPVSPYRHLLDVTAVTRTDYQPLHAAPDPTTTDVFTAIVGGAWTAAEKADLAALEKWCTKCTDEKPAHANCPGCACPCTLGVELVPIGGRHGAR